MLLVDPDTRDPEWRRASSPSRLWPAVALLGLVLGAAGLVAGLTADPGAPAQAATAARGPVPDYGPGRALMRDVDHAGDAHAAGHGHRP